uniref:Uncharacterized protein n=1 Tax=uncultured marine virus TaxID=186617 RepID=A0A0F7L7E4_9VIRU|nr:hypothetical protein [uncultured marine virus]
MKTLDILKEKKEEIIDGILNKLGEAFDDSHCNKMFCFDYDEKNDKIEVDYFSYTGQIVSQDNYIYSVKDYEIPSVDELGYDDYFDVDYDAIGYREFINADIDQHIMNLENI